MFYKKSSIRARRAQQRGACAFSPHQTGSSQEPDASLRVAQAVTTSPDMVLITEGEAAKILGCSVVTMQRRRWLRKPPTYVKVGRNVRYRVQDLKEYINNCAVSPCATA